MRDRQQPDHVGLVGSGKKSEFYSKWVPLASLIQKGPPPHF